jgi:hypothetical protein
MEGVETVSVVPHANRATDPGDEDLAIAWPQAKRHRPRGAFVQDCLFQDQIGNQG